MRGRNGGSDTDSTVPYSGMPSSASLSVENAIGALWSQHGYPLRLNNIVFPALAKNVKMGEDCSVSTISGSSATIGRGFSGNIIVGNSQDFVIGNGFSGNLVGSVSTTTIGDNCYFNIFDDLGGCVVNTGCNYNILKRCTECTLPTGLAYVNAEGDLSSVEFLPGDYEGVTVTVEGHDFKVAGVDSNGVLKVWNPADLVS